MTEQTINDALLAAIEHHQAGRLPQAEVLYRRVLRQAPDHPNALHLLGVIAHQVGRYQTAIDLITKAAALAPHDAVVQSNLGEAYRQFGHVDQAVACCRKAVELQPGFFDAWINLGAALTASAQLDAAGHAYRRALALQPQSARAHVYLGNVYRDQARVIDAITSYRTALAVEPQSIDALTSLGSLLLDRGRSEEAIACFQTIAALVPDSADAHNQLGHLLLEQQRFPDARTCFEKALTLNPRLATAAHNLGLVHKDTHDLDQAVRCFRQAVALDPTLAEAYNNLGVIHQARGELDQAIACFQRALDLKPGQAEACNNLGVILKERGRLDDAMALYRRALALKPDLTDAHNNLASVHQSRGEMEQALGCVRRALSISPARADLHSNLILESCYCEGVDATSLAEERQRWNQHHVRPLTGSLLPHSCDRSPDRRLRIGYVSPDLRDHAVGLNLLPLFEHHDHRQFEVFCYAHLERADEITARFRGYSDHWREITKINDEQLAATIRRDSIDVLVDLALHTAKNRLLTFARKPAPVQVSFAGYPGGTGLETIDYHLTDPYLEPPTADEAAGPDAPFRLPHSFWCYAPQLPGPAVTPLPAVANGYVTFGCFNNPCKINAAVLALWARVLTALPTARLHLLLYEGSHRERVLQQLAAHGVGRDRVTLVGRQSRENYLQLYQTVDLGLDTFPYNGHTTSLDSYWMGVPVISLVGSTVVGRAGLSQLSNLGLMELAAHTPDEFVRIASNLANDLPRLATLRESLRNRMQRSPLMDASGFARAIEAAYRTMWQRWCAQPISG